MPECRRPAKYTTPCALRDTRAWIAGVLLAGTFGAGAQAAPFLVNSAFVGSENYLQAQLAWSHAPGAATWTAPKLKLNLQAVKRRLEFKFSIARRAHADYPATTTSTGTTGEIDMKWSPLSRYTGAALDFAIQPGWILPAGGKPSQAHSLRLPVMVAHRFGATTLTTQMQYTHGFDTATDAYDWGLLGTWRSRPDVLIGVECYASRQTGSHRQTRLSGDIGAKWQVTQRLRIDGLAGHALNRSGEQFKLVTKYAF